MFILCAVSAKRKKEQEEVKQRRITDKEKRKRRRKMQKEKKSAENNREKLAKPSETTDTKGTFNKDGNILFSKIELTDPLFAKNKRKHGLPTGKNYKMMLQKVEKQKEKLQKLATTDKEAAKAP